MKYISFLGGYRPWGLTLLSCLIIGNFIVMPPSLSAKTTFPGVNPMQMNTAATGSITNTPYESDLEYDGQPWTATAIPKDVMLNHTPEQPGITSLLKGHFLSSDQANSRMDAVFLVPDSSFSYRV